MKLIVIYQAELERIKSNIELVATKTKDERAKEILTDAIGDLQNMIAEAREHRD